MSIYIKKRVFTLSLLLCFLSILIANCVQDKKSPALFKPKNKIGFSLKSLSGKNLPIGYFSQSHCTALLIVTTWSLPSQALLRDLKKDYQHLKSKGHNLIALAIDSQQNRSLVRNYFDFMKLNFPAAHIKANDKKLIREIGKTNAVPRLLVIDAQGRIILQDEGAVDVNKLKQLTCPTYN